jgi:hypothetical protein
MPNLLKYNGSFPRTIGFDMSHIWGKLCNYIQYSVKYVMYIVIYIILTSIIPCNPCVNYTQILGIIDITVVHTTVNSTQFTLKCMKSQSSSHTCFSEGLFYDCSTWAGLAARCLIFIIIIFSFTFIGIIIIIYTILNNEVSAWEFLSDFCHDKKIFFKILGNSKNN